MRAGRARKIGPRHPGGQLVDARTERTDHAVRVGYRYTRELARLGIAPEEASNARAGTELGKLRLAGGISEAQYWAGEEWCGICHRHAAIMGYSLPRPAAGGTGGRGCLPDPDERVVAAVRDAFRACYDALAEASRWHGYEVTRSTYDACVTDRAPRSVDALKIGLNALMGALDK